MLKIGAVLIVIFALSYFAFPQFRTALIGLAPLAIIAICPLTMLIAFAFMGKDKAGSCADCEHNKESKVTGAHRG